MQMIPTRPDLLVLMISGGIVPSLMGIVLTWFFEGRDGLKVLMASLSWERFIKAPRSSHAALLIPLVVNLILFSIMHTIYPRDVDLLSMVLERMLPGLVISICASLGEEFGWRGFAFRILNQHKLPHLKSTLIVGFVWALWHTFGNYIALGHYGLANFVVIVFCNAFVNLTAYSIFLSHLYMSGKGSMLLVIIFHGMISFSSFTFFHDNQSAMEQVMEAFIGCTLSSLSAALYFFQVENLI